MGGTVQPLERVVESALYVDDLARSWRFYVDVLGAEVLLDSARLLALNIGGASVLLLFQRGATSEPLSTPGGVVPPHGAVGIQHVAFAVADTAALASWARRLNHHGTTSRAVCSGNEAERAFTCATRTAFD